MRENSLKLYHPSEVFKGFNICSKNSYSIWDQFKIVVVSKCIWSPNRCSKNYFFISQSCTCRMKFLCFLYLLKATSFFIVVCLCIILYLCVCIFYFHKLRMIDHGIHIPIIYSWVIFFYLFIHYIEIQGSLLLGLSNRRE